MSSKNKNNSYVIVTVLDQDLEFGIEETTTGQYLFNQIICATGIQKEDYFGLQYDNQRNQTLWLNLEETIWKQPIVSTVGTKMYLKIKNIPKKISDDIMQDVILLKYFFKNINEEVLNDTISCSSERAVLLASYQIQATLGDYDEKRSIHRYLENVKFLPQTIIDQPNMSIRQWENIVMNLHKQKQGTLMEKAMFDYLKIAQNLDHYADYHDKKWPIVLTYETLDIQDSPDHMVVEESETKSKCFCCCQCCEKIAKYLNSLINY